MENTDYAVDILQSLRDKQISISLDDFGTGFSSLSYLRRLPVDKVKLIGVLWLGSKPIAVTEC